MSAVGYDLGTTIGTLEIGATVSSFLLGVLVLQAYIYYSQASADRLVFKLPVAIVCLCEVGHAICITHVVYTLSVTNYGNPQSLLQPPVTWGLSLFFYSPVAPIVQTFFAWRVYRLSQKRYIPIVIVSISFLVLVGSLLGAAESTRLTKDHAQFIKKWSWLLSVITSLRLVNDLLITTTLVTYLYLQRRNTEFAKTLLMLDKLMLWTLQTGLITSVTNIARMICFYTMKHNWVWFSIVFFESRLFANSFLAALNSRPALRAIKEDLVYVDTQYGSGSVSAHHRQPTNIAIELTRTVIHDGSDPRATHRPDVKDLEMMSG